MLVQIRKLQIVSCYYEEPEYNVNSSAAGTTAVCVKSSVGSLMLLLLFAMVTRCRAGSILGEVSLVFFLLLALDNPCEPVWQSKIQKMVLSTKRRVTHTHTHTHTYTPHTATTPTPTTPTHTTHTLSHPHDTHSHTHTTLTHPQSHTNITHTHTCGSVCVCVCVWGVVWVCESGWCGWVGVMWVCVRVREGACGWCVWCVYVGCVRRCE
jgi:hypothetical protein